MFNISLLSTVDPTCLVLLVSIFLNWCLVSVQFYFDFLTPSILYVCVTSVFSVLYLVCFSFIYGTCLCMIPSGRFVFKTNNNVVRLHQVLTSVFRFLWMIPFMFYVCTRLFVSLLSVVVIRMYLYCVRGFDLNCCVKKFYNSGFQVFCLLNNLLDVYTYCLQTHVFLFLVSHMLSLFSTLIYHVFVDVNVFVLLYMIRSTHDLSSFTFSLVFFMLVERVGTSGTRPIMPCVTMCKMLYTGMCSISIPSSSLFFFVFFMFVDKVGGSDKNPVPSNGWLCNFIYTCIFGTTVAYFSNGPPPSTKPVTNTPTTPVSCSKLSQLRCIQN